MGDAQSIDAAITQAILKSSQEAVLIVDVAGVITHVSHSTQRVLGVPEDLLLRRSLAEVLPDVSAVLGRAGTDRAVVDYKEGYINVHWADFYEGKRRLGTVVTLTNSAGAGQTNAELTRLQHRIRELEAILESSHDEIFVCDADGVCLHATRASERLYGVPLSEIIGKSFTDLEAQGLYTPSVIPLVQTQLRSVTLLQVTRTGRRLLVTATPVLDDDGKLVKIVGNTRDVSELFELREQVARQNNGANGPQSVRYTEAVEQAGADDWPLIVASPAMMETVQKAERVAKTPATVLLLGESGVGKDQIARLIHHESDRCDGPFVHINCGAIPESLIESELFGYERGAFTGARRDGKDGLIVLASGGTLYLDEVGELPLHLQVKLLHVVQQRQVTPVGGSRPIPVDIRIVSATNRDLKQMVANGQFRTDLYYRLNVVTIAIAPLRDRPEDVLALAEHFLARFNSEFGVNKTLSPFVLPHLLAHPWPGNIRELENLIQFLVVTCPESEILPDHLPEEMKVRPHVPPSRGRLNLRAELEKFEKEILLQAMESARTTYELAESLGISQSTVVRKLQRHGLAFAELRS